MNIEEIDEWFPPGEALKYESFPEYHHTLRAFGRSDLSWKIDRCKMDGMRLDCDLLPIHDSYLPIPCNRRTCPDCAKIEMSKQITRFLPLEHIFFNEDGRPKKYVWSEGENPQGWRLRFWTFTTKAKPYQSLREPAKAIKEAIHRYWNTMYGQKSKARGGPYKKAGGVFTIEVGAGWNLHSHALIYGPYENDLNDNRSVWGNAIQKAGWYPGNRLEVKQARPGAVKELISYPFNPAKMKKLSHELLAFVELAFSGKNKTENDPGITAIRRIIVKGIFYDMFPPMPDPVLLCPDCVEEVFDNPERKIFPGQMTWENDFNDIKGKRHVRKKFTSEELWDRRANRPIVNELTGKDRKGIYRQVAELVENRSKIRGG